MDEAILKLTPKEVTIVLQALSELPYKDSASIIRKIVEQIAGQASTFGAEAR